MGSIRRWAPELSGYTWGAFRRDLASGLVGAVVTVPQGIAYAIVAGVPPVAGLYAAALPCVLGSLLRSSPWVVTGPTNALSLLVGGTVGSMAVGAGADPMTVAVTLAFMAGAFQVALALLRMGVLTDYVSTPVVTGYVTGAAILIAAGQLANATGVEDHRGSLWTRGAAWFDSIGSTDGTAMGLAAGTALVILGLRRLHPLIPGAPIALAAAAAAGLAFDPGGLVRVGDLAPVAGRLPPLTAPSLALVPALLPAAVAVMVLSLVESNAVARSLAARSHVRLDANLEFLGQGVANLAAAFSGGLPVSGSLNRSTLNWTSGARSRLAGAFSGLFVLVIVLGLGPVVDLVPVASLAGLLFVVAGDLVDVPRIRAIVRVGHGDLVAFLVTLGGTLVLHVEQAIYLGVGVSILLYLRRARHLVVSELVVDEQARLREVEPDVRADRCPRIRVYHVEGRLFFAAATELRHALEHAFEDRGVDVFVLRLKRTTGLDATVAEVLTEAARGLDREGRHLLLVGMRRETMARLKHSGLEESVGTQDLFPARAGWFEAMDMALERALQLTASHADHACAIERYLAGRRDRHARPASA
jgi:SulP family sulfate permease